MSIDGTGRRVAADPYRGTVEAVLECAANLACVGAEPLGPTNNLNFGNPEKPHIAWQLTEAVRGLGDACRALDAPVVGGNVSLYNEGAGGPIYPTPVVGMVGELPDAARAGRLGFARAGDAVALAGPFRPSLAGVASSPSCAASRCPTGCPRSTSPRVRAAQEAIRDAVRAGALSSAHDVAEGGFARRGRRVLPGRRRSARRSTSAPSDDADGRSLFGEGPGGFVVSGPRAALARARRARRRSTSSAPSAATRWRSRIAGDTIDALARRAARGARRARALLRLSGCRLGGAPLVRRC